MARKSRGPARRSTSKGARAAGSRAPAAFDWGSAFRRIATRRAIAAMVNGCRRMEGLDLDPSLPADLFASDLAGAVPGCERFLPKGIALDAKRVRRAAAAAKALAVRQGLRAKSDGGPRLARLCLALMSRGVRSLDYFYDGGWDEVAPVDEWPTLAFVVPPPGGERGERRAAISTAEWIRKTDPAFDPNELMYRLLDDSGAGPPEYSQHFRVDLWRWKLRTYGYELVTYD